ncbi:unnamed protein product [Cylicocyclus nassatus]|uniref:Uncharacterized protein n=1 Tax=Cylicocyclus nassatus TaxID=53992 RepID=A0AA36MCG8_CYLNA|nr:unnamed protein product [Cylicocyclus nassatus]
MIRSILALLLLESKSALRMWVSEMWFYQTELLATAAVWLQLIINRSMQQHMLGTRHKRHDASTKTIHISMKSRSHSGIQ